VSRQPSASFQVAPLATTITAVEDLNRFPSESLHSFSFAHQSEDSIHNRQTLLKRSLDFMRDKLGWAASNPGLLAAQAKLSGDKEVQSMMELLSRAHLIGEEADLAHGLGSHGPITGPADLAGNVFDKSFGMPRSESPDFLDEKKPVHWADPEDPHSVLKSLINLTDNSTKVKGELTLDSISKALSEDNAEQQTLPSKPRALLKRTLTSTDDLSIQTKLTDTLAQPYSVNESGPPESLPSSKKYPALPPLKMTPPIAGSMSHTTPLTAAPHGHGNRWTPVSQAIFTTEAQAPWTITAANDLACLVFGVTRAEVRKLGILEVVKEDRRKWLEDKLQDPMTGSVNSKGSVYQNQRTSPNSTSTLSVGSGLTAKLLSKPPSRVTGSKRRAQSDDGVGSSYVNRGKPRGGPQGSHHSHQKSRGVLLCGDVLPILKRNGALGSATIWVKEKKAGLIWVLEEIAEDLAFVTVDEVGCVTNASGSVQEIWASERIRRGMDIKRLVPAIPRIAGTNTGALDYKSIADMKTYTALTTGDIHIPVTVELQDNSTFRVSSFPHIAGMMTLNSQNLKITGSNSVFSSALLGRPNPEGLHITEIIPSFEKVLNHLTEDEHVQLVDGMVVPEHSFRRARAFLAIREGKADAASIFLRPSGLAAAHRDGSEIMIDVQMRVVKSERSSVEEDVIEEVAEEDAELASQTPSTEVVYALWMTYSRHLHSTFQSSSLDHPEISRPPSPCLQPAPPEAADLPVEEQSSDSGSAKSIIDRAARGEVKPPPAELLSISPLTDRDPSPDVITRRKTINDFVVLEEMGQGAYGQVKLCRYRRPPGTTMVIKYVTKKRILVDTWTRDRNLGTVPLEIHVLNYLRREELRHPNIVQMADFFEDDINYYIEMVPHGVPGMDLFDFIEMRTDMSEMMMRKIFTQVAEALRHLHEVAKVVHRDVKDENIILDGETNVKLIDFGSAAYIRNGPFDVFVGTIGKNIKLATCSPDLIRIADYAAPEVLAGKPYRGKEQDVWALGILLYTIIYKENPFYSIDEIMDHDLRVPYVISESSIDLVRTMLDRDVEKRSTISDVLNHPWCMEFDQEALDIELERQKS
jgi:protein-serine/threonine kinase